MVSWKVMVVLLVLFVLIDEFDATRNRSRNANRRDRNNRARQRPRGNRNRAGGGGARSQNGAGRSRPGLTARGRCEEIQVPMCKGLVGYTHTRLPNRFNHTSQLHVYRVLEHLWAQIDTGCSNNLRLLACSLYLPRCNGRGPAREPCRKTCKVTQRACGRRLEALGYSWPEQFDCRQLPKKRCLKHGPHQTCAAAYTRCQPIDLPMCQGLSYSDGMSPNMFGQCNRSQIAAEMEQFRPLVERGCSPRIGFFLCGVYMPFCSERDGMMSFPCRELCEEVQTSCESAYRSMTGGLPWPNKFQCHRYPSASNSNFTCVMHDRDVSTTTIITP
ncbi:uncharacterized protein LOC143277417 [Babylonia areolata]|uniref:uncharacterized protein LOC143277417 n=1 Tax=Babylonia areolata TaxID=304850 RepID=UPI003FD2D072